MRDLRLQDLIKKGKTELQGIHPIVKQQSTTTANPLLTTVIGGRDVFKKKETLRETT